ncbi:MAG: apolipoprotein N-acyltransferase [Bacteroidetes bacterium]|nr:apolipoprotein N-acyltransferase [Bacteroidota bacterium]
MLCYLSPPQKFLMSHNSSDLPQKTHPYFKAPPNWLISSVLYGLSWSMFFDANLSFLAWFAYVPLFYDLEKKNSFWSFYKTGLFFSVVAYLIICHGFLFSAGNHLLVIAGSANELLMSSFVFALLYPFKKKFGFTRALILFPFIIALWEMVYQWLDHSYGYLALSHSQCQNTWIIQFIDLFGVWSIATWVMGFNVLLFFISRKSNGKYFTFRFLKKILLICCLMILPPLGYSMIRFLQIEDQNRQKVNITLINTNFSVRDSIIYEDYVSRIERLTFLTDSIDYESKSRNLRTDLYVWPEGAVDYGNDSMFYSFIDSAVRDWHTPLLAGMQIIPENATATDRRRVNRAALISPGVLQNEFQHYDKVHLAPGNEKIPYHQFLVKIPGFPVAINDSSWLKSGNKVQLIELQLQNGRKVKMGTPICLEQNYPEIWSEMARRGAGFFVQLSYESWWTARYFKIQMANITRLRCIETRRSAARCSNGGITEFIDGYGKIQSQAKPGEGCLTASLSLNNEITFFVKYGWNYCVICLIFIAGFSVVFFLKQPKPAVG